MDYIGKYIKKQAKRNGIDFPDDYKNKLDEIIGEIPCPYPINFLSSFYLTPNILNGYAYIFSQQIGFSLEWAAKLVLFDSPEIRNAFKMTVGHEMTHLERNDLYYFTFSCKNNRFVNWTREVHADFGSAQIMANNERQPMINAMKYKKDFKEKDINCCIHPSWNRRLYYLQNYNFTSDLILKIAEDSGCTKHKVIQKVIDQYEDIILH